MVDITKTRIDLIERAATELGKLVAGQNIEDEDRETIDNLVDPLIQQLAIDGVVYVDDSEGIRVEYFLPLARLLANEAAPSFGQAKNPTVQASEESYLRRLTAMRPPYEPLRVDYF